MRIQQQHDEEQKQFVNYLLQIGEENEFTYPNIGEDFIKLYDNMVFDKEVELLIFKIFFNIKDNYNNKDIYVNYIKDQAILTIKNEDVNDINKQIIDIFSGKAQEFLLAD